MTARTSSMMLAKRSAVHIHSRKVVGSIRAKSLVLSSYLDSVVRDRQIYTASTAVFRQRDTDQWSEMRGN